MVKHLRPLSIFVMNWKYLISLGQQHIRGSRTSISITVLVDFYDWWLVGQLALGGSLWFWQKCANGGKCARASVVREKSWVKVEFCLQQPEPSAACRPTYPLPEIGTGLQLAWLAPQVGADPGLAGPQAQHWHPVGWASFPKGGIVEGRRRFPRRKLPERDHHVQAKGRSSKVEPLQGLQRTH